MSFKRDVDDKNLLKNLNDQRVKELLGNHIPQDEAKLLSNGRLTCTICLHRPVFDTINMLANHRRGKRHLSELSKYIKCKEDGERKAIQRKFAPEDAFCNKKVKYSESLARNCLLGYKHVAAKQSVLKYQRKPILEVRQVSKKKLPNPSSQNNSENKASITIKHYLKNMTRKTSMEKIVERNRENYGVDLQKTSNELSPQTSLPKESEPHLSESGERMAVSHDYEIKLRMNGWIKDFSGNWIKDPNVEFDSDEDETPPLPP